MSKLSNFFRTLSALSGGRWAIYLISMLFPVVIMAGFGVFLAIKYGYLVELSLAIAGATLLFAIPLFIVSRRHQGDERRASVAEGASSFEPTVNDALPDGLVKASPEWSEPERKIWNQAKVRGRALLVSDPQWSDLDVAGLEILELVATQFGKKTLDFSLPEGLKLLEEISRRYKLVVTDHVPGIEYLKVSYIKYGYEAYDQYGEVGKKVIQAAIWANHAKNLYLNPIKAGVDIIRQESTSSMTKGIFDEMQIHAKQALLDEVAAVAIDLYSGRFRLDDDVEHSDIARDDQKRLAEDLEPIRVVIAGQTSAGKSSVVNMLGDQFVAEVDPLPSTDTSTVYQAQINESDVRIVDLKGLDGDLDTETAMLNEVTQADLVLWVLKADQSSRSLDKQLKDRVDAFYDDPRHLSRKRPRIVGVVNQVDRLKPISDWQPPYALESPQDAKAEIIAQALGYNSELLRFDAILPLSLAQGKTHWGEEELQHLVRTEIDTALQVQRNRQRMDAIDKGTSWTSQLKRAAKVSKKAAPSAAKLAVKRIFKN